MKSRFFCENSKASILKCLNLQARFRAQPQGIALPKGEQLQLGVASLRLNVYSVIFFALALLAGGLAAQEYGWHNLVDLLSRSTQTLQSSNSESSEDPSSLKSSRFDTLSSDKLPEELDDDFSRPVPQQAQSEKDPSNSSVVESDSEIKKSRIAVSSLNYMLGVKLSPLQSQGLLTELIHSLQRTRKFTVLLREHLELERLSEERRPSINSPELDLDQPEGELNHQYQADYLVLPTVSDFTFSRTRRAIPELPNAYRTQDFGHLTLSTKIVRVANQEIVSTFESKASFNTPAQTVKVSGAEPDHLHFSGLVRRVVQETTNQIINNVFPISVIKINGLEAYLNQGDIGTFRVGQVWEVFNLDKETLIDPYSGESLGKVEELVGTIRITKINPKFSVGVLSPLTDKMVKIGAVLRKRGTDQR